MTQPTGQHRIAGPAVEAPGLFTVDPCNACYGTGRCGICAGGTAGPLYVCAACRGSNRCYMDCHGGFLIEGGLL